MADFISMLAHELINPLAAIRGLSDMLLADDLDREDQRYAVTAISGEVDRLINLVGDVRTAAAIDRGDLRVQPRPVSLGVLLSAAAAFAQTLPRDHSLVSSTTIQEMVQADPERIEQVLRLLLSNAAKFSPRGSPIDLRTRLEAGRVRIEVADTGSGLSPEDIPRIFEKFVQARDRAGGKGTGLGLGLYIARHIVQAHGSDLTVASQPGQGSVFAFTLEVAR